MKAYKGFNSDLTCRGYQFSKSEVNRTDEANCKRNGFHCAENPLDCLDYYPDYKRSVYYVVEASGDINETDGDSKISCTEMDRYPKRRWNSNVAHEKGCAFNGYALVRGKNPVACGSIGDVLMLVQEEKERCEVQDIVVYVIDGKDYLPDVWYGMDDGGAERSLA